MDFAFEEKKMNIRYQGSNAETDAPTVAAFLESQGVLAAESVVEYRGEVLQGSTSLAAPLEEGAELNVFRIVAGG